MPSFKCICGLAAVGLAALSTALPAYPKLSKNARRAYDRSVENLERRQNPATGVPDGLGDVDILQLALTAEFLETTFYQQGFAMFPPSDFMALGLQQEQVNDLVSIGVTEQIHVDTLLSAISATGTAPVQPCTYKFGFTDAAGMVATAAVLENVGVSAYLGAAPLVKSPAILGVAASILTVEARHQTLIRTASKAMAIPAAFDTPLDLRAVFSLAAGFIDSCPDGSNLKITPFPTLTMTSGASNMTAGSMVTLQTQATMSSGMFCAFTNQATTQFTSFDGTNCQVPQNLAGVTYVSLSNAAPPTGMLTDDITMAGPIVIVAS